MKKVIFISVLIVVIAILLIKYILPPFGLPMSISSKGASYDIRNSKKKNVFLWEYEIRFNNNDSIPFIISEAYCEKQHYWKMNQMIYVPNLYEDESMVQIRINSQDKGKWDEYRIDNFDYVNPFGINKKIITNNLTDTLRFSIINETKNISAGQLILVKKSIIK